MRNFIFYVCILLVIVNIETISQEVAKKTPRADFIYIKQSDGSRLLKTNLYLFENRITTLLSPATIEYTISSDSIKANIVTDKEGNAYLIIDKDVKIKPVDSLLTFKSFFPGNDTLESISQEISVKDATLELFLEEIDSVRTVKARLTKLNASGEMIPVAGENINLYVPRMFSLLKFGEGATDEEGFVTVEFPKDLPGNSDSTLMVIAKLEEHELYANIEAKKQSNWGIPIIHRIPESHRALWTEIAPVWMIITLTVLLLGVWGHYIFVIIQIVMVKIESKKQKEA